MEAASPARLYATLAGAFLLLLGIAGFFYSASFGAPGDVAKVLGAFGANAWTNLLYVVAGSLGLLAGGLASRRYALAAGSLFTVLAVWGFALDAGDAILGFLPAGGAENVLRLAIGLLGLAAAAATPKRSRRDARAQAAG
ncbi:MAG TPA: DUF4383 domain-containing protein [Solirubrobacterales bacterium]|nr:DUF4383 domain-containing protein [Solirubrobacterales bacterium]